MAAGKDLLGARINDIERLLGAAGLDAETTDAVLKHQRNRLRGRANRLTDTERVICAVPFGFPFGWAEWTIAWTGLVFVTTESVNLLGGYAIRSDDPTFSDIFVIPASSIMEVQYEEHGAGLSMVKLVTSMDQYQAETTYPAGTFVIITSHRAAEALSNAVATLTHLPTSAPTSPARPDAPETSWVYDCRPNESALTLLLAEATNSSMQSGKRPASEFKSFVKRKLRREFIAEAGGGLLLIVLGPILFVLGVIDVYALLPGLFIIGVFAGPVLILVGLALQAAAAREYRASLRVALSDSTSSHQSAQDCCRNGYQRAFGKWSDSTRFAISVGHFVPFTVLQQYDRQGWDHLAQQWEERVNEVGSPQPACEPEVRLLPVDDGLTHAEVTFRDCFFEHPGRVVTFLTTVLRVGSGDWRLANIAPGTRVHG